MAKVKSTDVEIEALRNASVWFERRMDELDKRSGRVSAQVGRLAGAWDGPAYRLLVSRYEQTKAQYEEFMKEFKELNRRMGEAAKRYDRADDSVRARARKL